MLQVGERIRFTVVQLGALNRAEVDNAVGLANQTQRALDFVFHPTRTPLKRQYKLTNRGYDLDQAVNDTLRQHTLPQPLLFLTDEAYGDRADRLSHPRRITDAIVQAILSSHLVVADITGRNPNVFYELGIAHAAGIDVLMVTQDRRAIPFDVRTERAIRYNMSPAGLSKLTREVVDMTL